MYDRGAVWSANLPGIGRKPAVLISSQAVSLRMRPIVARITSVERPPALPTVVPLDPGEVDELPLPSVVVCHDIHTISHASLLRHLGTLRRSRLVQIEDAMMAALGMERG